MESIKNIERQGMVKKERAIEVEGSDVEDAIKKAMNLLKVSRDEIKVKIVCEEQKGLFGMEGAKTAKIKVTIKEKRLDK